MTLRTNLTALLTATYLAVSGCAGVQAPSSSSAPAVEQAERPRDGPGRFFNYLDENDIQFLGFGGMHLRDQGLVDRARAQGTPLTIEVFTNDYLEGLAERGYTTIIVEHFWQESKSDLDMFSMGEPIVEGSVLHQNLQTIRSGEEVRAFLHRARDLRVSVYPGGMDHQDMQTVISVRGLHSLIGVRPEAQEELDRVGRELASRVAQHTYRHAINVLQVNPDTRIVTYNGMMHNNTTFRPEGRAACHGANDIGACAQSISIADEFQQNHSGEYREVDIVQLDILNLHLEGLMGQRNLGRLSASQIFFEYIMLTSHANANRSYFRENPQQDRLLIVYGRQRSD